MIVQINKENSSAYADLFKEASTLLNDGYEYYTTSPNNTGTLPSHLQIFNDLTEKQINITTLNEYYAFLLSILTEAQRQSDSSFNINNFTLTDVAFNLLRLPLDEENFFIDANTRKITIPSNFQQNGVGVQTDQDAETLYFLIDRFYDSTDLASQDIVIQWEIKNAEGKTVYGVSSNFGKDLSIPGKIIFGWRLGSPMTDVAGTIKFAVRFYTETEINNKFYYSFATLPAEIRVGATLNSLNKEDAIQDKDFSDKIIKRLNNRKSGIYDEGYPIPDAPVITKSPFILNPNNDNKNRIIEKIEYVEEDNDNQSSITKIGIEAKVNDIGIITCSWERSKLQDIEDEENSTSNLFNSQIEYRQIENSGYVENNPGIEYYKHENNKYVLINDFNSARIVDNENEDPKYQEADNTTPYIFYEKIYTTTVDKFGEYKAKLQSTSVINSRELVVDDIITVKGPEEFSFGEEGQDTRGTDNEDDDIIYTYDNNEEEIHVPYDNTSHITLKTGITTNIYDKYEYNWYQKQKKNSDNETPLEGSDEDFTFNLPSADSPEDCYIYAEVKASRNKGYRTATSKFYHISPALTDGDYPKLKATYGTGEVKGFGIEDENTYIKTSTIPFKFTIKNNKNKGFYDVRLIRTIDDLEYQLQQSGIEEQFLNNISSSYSKVNIDFNIAENYRQQTTNDEQVYQELYPAEELSDILVTIPFDKFSQTGCYYYCIVTYIYNGEGKGSASSFIYNSNS